jgi:hypothetical protein
MGIISAINANMELLKTLNLPEGFIPVSGVALGFPMEPLTTEKELKPTIKIDIIK